ncbi:MULTISPECIES: amino acid ABC transporter permease [unclassified Rhizobium]|uniref:amino acid ABC transporter permease n=1 Tax=unclassified Rhizobium TaxID=2613769 RepID=UPI0007F07112|nr:MULTISPECIES: amino acid ABC transporter permease [unclassified Rhizobium]ANK85615.1 glutamate/glutamine/aspartate/asparagine ABC transporter permease protein BztC [Rhizobium sp. N731]ANL15862.1 glutamate/glutamine/aspartate/asparagine ABC transporter permease protein BztC [Rhizobium sp. N1314]
MARQEMAFVRQEILPAAAPPARQAGVIRWSRKNLFSGWINTSLTVLSAFTIFWLVSAIGPWLRNSIWSATSLAECRQILGDSGGACWGVIRDRWPQLLFGFYPAQMYWRPVLAFLLLFVALLPILFSGASRRLAWFSTVFPGLAYFLIWGGSIWFPVSVYAGFVFAVLIGTATKGMNTGVQAALALLGCLFWWFAAATPVERLLENAIPLSLSAVPSHELGGFLLSVVIGVTGIALSLPMGILFALGRRSRMPFIKAVSVIFIEFIRGVPLITLLFTASLLLNYFLPPGTNFDLILRVIIMVSLFATAYMAEVIRGGLAALPRGQYEAAESLGLDYWQAQRLIIMPQALKISIPSIVNTFIGLFKDTTLVVFIGLLDPIALTNSIRATTDWQGIYWELFIFVGALFFVCCFGMSRYSVYLEHRLKTDHR